METTMINETETETATLLPIDQAELLKASKLRGDDKRAYVIDESNDPRIVAALARAAGWNVEEMRKIARDGNPTVVRKLGGIAGVNLKVVQATARRLSKSVGGRASVADPAVAEKLETLAALATRAEALAAEILKGMTGEVA